MKNTMEPGFAAVVLTSSLSFLISVYTVAAGEPSAGQDRIAVIFDTDIGGDIDDIPDGGILVERPRS